MHRLAYFSRETLISLRRNVLMTIAGILTVAVSLFLFGLAVLVMQLVENGTAQWRGGVELEIFMRVDATPQQVADVRNDLSNDPDVERFRYLSKDDALQEFQRLFQDSPELTRNVDAASLPESFRVAPVEPELTEAVADRYRGVTGVEDVQTAGEAVDRLVTITNWLRWGLWAAAAALFASSLFLIVNTIRLATYARRREIEVMKLVGASNWFVRIPFMAEGFVQGIVGAGFAFGFVYLVKVLLTDALENAQNIFRGFYVTSSETLWVGLLVLLLGALIGTIGALLGLRRFLDV